MIQNQSLSNAAMLSGRGTSAHETGTVMNTNALRFYSPQGTRHRRASSTATLRGMLCEELLAAFPSIRRIRLKDTGTLFVARLWLESGYTLMQKAYNLQNLRGMLLEALAV